MLMKKKQRKKFGCLRSKAVGKDKNLWTEGWSCFISCFQLILVDCGLSVGVQSCGNSNLTTTSTERGDLHVCQLWACKRWRHQACVGSCLQRRKRRVEERLKRNQLLPACIWVCMFLRTEGCPHVSLSSAPSLPSSPFLSPPRLVFSLKALRKPFSP